MSALLDVISSLMVSSEVSKNSSNWFFSSFSNSNFLSILLLITTILFSSISHRLFVEYKLAKLLLTVDKSFNIKLILLSILACPSFTLLRSSRAFCTGGIRSSISESSFLHAVVTSLR